MSEFWDEMNEGAAEIDRMIDSLDESESDVILRRVPHDDKDPDVVMFRIVKDRLGALHKQNETATFFGSVSIPTDKIGDEMGLYEKLVVNMKDGTTRVYDNFCRLGGHVVFLGGIVSEGRNRVTYFVYVWDDGQDMGDAVTLSSLNDWDTAIFRGCVFQGYHSDAR